MFTVEITYLDGTTEKFKTIEWVIETTILRIELGIGENASKWRYIPLTSIKFFNSKRR